MEDTRSPNVSPISRNTTFRESLPVPRSLEERSLPTVSNVAVSTPEQQKPGEEKDCSGEQKSSTKLMKLVRPVLEVKWLPEFSSLMIAFVSLLAIVLLLLDRKDKPQPDWPSLLNLNAIIAIFSMILKAAALYSVSECISEQKWIWFTASQQPVSDFDRFDSASRGPWGSFLLLLKRPRSFATALGSLITILSIASDPFTQQVIQYRNCLIPVPGSPATIAQTNNYTDGASHFSRGKASVSVAMYVAIFQGLMNPPSNASSIMKTYCQSGNCTFPETDNSAYKSLAMCSSVQDISSTASRRRTIKRPYHNYTLPTGLSLAPGQVLTSRVTQSAANDSSKPLLTIEILMATFTCNDSRPKNQTNCVPKPYAIRVTLTPCIHTYTNVSYTNARFSETIASTINLPFVPELGYYSLAGAYPALPGVDCTPSSTPHKPKTAGTKSLPNGVRYRAGFRAEDDNLTYYDPRCTYDFGPVPTKAFEAVFGRDLFGTVAQPFNL